jgi:hypothetical protein
VLYLIAFPFHTILAYTNELVNTETWGLYQCFGVLLISIVAFGAFKIVQDEKPKRYGN